MNLNIELRNVIKCLSIAIKCISNAIICLSNAIKCLSNAIKCLSNAITCFSIALQSNFCIIDSSPATWLIMHCNSFIASSVVL
jgi:hypothetical protein